MAGEVRFTTRFRWGALKTAAGPQMKATRKAILEDLADEFRKRAPHPSLVAAVKVLDASVVVDHPAAWVFDKGAKPNTPNVGALEAWADDIGKGRDAAHAIITTIQRRGLRAQPYVEAATEAAIKKINNTFGNVWAKDFSGGRIR